MYSKIKILFTTKLYNILIRRNSLHKFVTHTYKIQNLRINYLVVP